MQIKPKEVENSKDRKIFQLIRLFNVLMCEWILFNEAEVEKTKIFLLIMAKRNKLIAQMRFFTRSTFQIQICSLIANMRLYVIKKRILNILP